MQRPTSHGSKTKPFAQITSLPSRFNGPGGAAIRANGLRDECVNDYSWEWGRRPHRLIMLTPPLSIYMPLLSHSWPFYSTDPCLTHVSKHAADLCGILLHLNLMDQAVRHITSCFFCDAVKKQKKGKTASSTWCTIF